MSRSLPIVLALLTVACSARDPASAPAPAPAPKPPIVTLELGLVGAEPGAEAMLAVRHQIAAPWHIYWQNPGDSGLRTRLTLAPAAAQAGPVRYPAPDQFTDLGGQITYGWEREAVLFIPLAALAPDARLELRSDWLACHESCIPGTSELAVRVGELELRDSDPNTRVMLERLPQAAGDRLRASWTGATLRVEATDPGAELSGFFPYASDRATLQTTALDDAGLTLDYRFPSSAPTDAGQGVVRWIHAGQTRWLELAVPWPAP